MTLGMTEEPLKETEEQTDTITVDGKFIGDVIVTRNAFPKCSA